MARLAARTRLRTGANDNFLTPSQLVGASFASRTARRSRLFAVLATPAIGEADGQAAVAGVGGALDRALGAAAGAATVAGVGPSIVAGAGEADGQASVTGAGRSIGPAGAFEADGFATVAGRQASLDAAAGEADGQASAGAAGMAAAISSGEADGNAAVSGVGAEANRGVGEADGQASVAGAGAEPSAGAGDADGAASVTADSASIAASAGEADGSADVEGAGQHLGPSGAGEADGSADVSGAGGSVIGSAGEADGSATVAGVGESFAGAGAGEADGQASVVGVAEGAQATGLRADPRFVCLQPLRQTASEMLVRKTSSFLVIPVPQGPDFSVMDVGETVTGATDFARWLPPGTTIASVVSIEADNYMSGAGAPVIISLVGGYQIGAAPVSLGGSGIANAAVLQQWTGLVMGTARVTVTIRTSDGQTLIGWAHQPVQIPN